MLFYILLVYDLWLAGPLTGIIVFLYVFFLYIYINLHIPNLAPFLFKVCVDNVLKTMKENANKASSILLTAIPQISQMDWGSTINAQKVSLKLLKLSKWLFFLIYVIILDIFSKHDMHTELKPSMSSFFVFLSFVVQLMSQSSVMLPKH